MDISVCLVTSEFPPDVGGIASHVWELARSLAPLVKAVHVVHPVGCPPGSRFPSLDPTDELEGVVVHRPSLLKVQPVYAMMLRPWLARLSREASADIFHIHGVRPLAATRTLPAPTVFTNHSSGFLRRLEASAGRKRRTARLMEHVSALIGPSDELVEAARTLAYRGPARMIPNGVDTGRFRPGPSPLRREWGIADHEVVVLLARRLVDKNGVLWFARALALLPEPNYRVVIAGDGPERAKMEAELAGAGRLDRVRFLGSVPNAAMPSIYAAADLSVLPSLAEATSIAGLEAMATALPLVGTRVGGIPTIIEDGVTGVLVPPRDPAALAQALAGLIADGERRRRLGDAARLRVEQSFAWPIIARQTLAVYRACLETPAPPAPKGT